MIKEDLIPEIKAKKQTKKDTRTYIRRRKTKRM